MPLHLSKKATGVYGVRNKINSKLYVGSAAVSLRQRLASHRQQLTRGKHWNNHLQYAWNKYGGSNFEFVVLERCQPDKCIELEQHWIDFYKSYDSRQGYNKSPTAGSPLGVKRSPELKQRLSKSQIQRWDVPGAREQRSEDRKEMYTDPTHKAQLTKMNKTRTDKYRGIPYSQEVKDKIATKTKERMADPAVRQKLKDAWVKRKQRNDEEGWNRGPDGKWISTKSGESSQATLFE